MNMTGLNVRKISNKLLIENLSQLRKRTFYMQGYFSSYPNDFAICYQFIMQTKRFDNIFVAFYSLKDAHE